MDISNNYYRYVVINLVHQISNIHATSELRYQLVTSTGIVITPAVFIQAGKSTSVNFDQEGVYQILLRTGDGVDHVINVNYFPEYKKTIIESVKDFICNCSNIKSDSCYNGQDPTIKEYKELSFMTTTMYLYLGQLITPQYTRNYVCCINDVINKDVRIINGVSNSINELDVYGRLPNNIDMLRLQILYYFLLFYVIENDFATLYVAPTNTGGGTGGLPDDPIGIDSFTGQTKITDTAYVISLFNLEEVKKCTIDLNINIDQIIQELSNCYSKNPLGLCVITNVIPDPENPTTASISNLTYQGYQPVVAINTVINPVVFSWDNNETPSDLILDDSGYGEIIQLQTSGTSQDASNKSYIRNTRGSVIWKLSGSNVETIELMTKWINPTYVGKRDSNLTSKVTADEVLTNSSVTLSDNLQQGFTTKLNNIVGEITYIVVAKEEHSKYTIWENLDDTSGLDKSSIGDENQLQFIVSYNNEIFINDKAYFVYIMQWTGNFIYNLKLS